MSAKRHAEVLAIVKATRLTKAESECLQHFADVHRLRVAQVIRQAVLLHLSK